ncbi:hypothetical protein WUBG_17473 [Wuchereria bancrofti]|uniref:Uncharacterized protein n=1 Tax=Wuchereria bancrofti TaxID=6293 RepID=J9E3W3_WUCBA|nr:hypothetical protein WUBG_17473 [Wuchereria bancrofti]
MSTIFTRKIFDVTNCIITSSLLQSVTFPSQQYCHHHQQIHRMTSSNHILALENLNPNVIAMEYAVRGPLVIRALAIEKD